MPGKDIAAWSDGRQAQQVLKTVRQDRQMKDSDSLVAGQRLCCGRVFYTCDASSPDHPHATSASSTVITLLRQGGTSSHCALL